MAEENAEYFDIWAAITEACGVAGLANIDAERIRAASCLPASSFTAPFAGALDLLTAVHQHDMRVVLICNAIWRTSDDYWSDFRSFRLSDQIDAIVSSVDLRARKPSRAFFEAAFQEAAAPPRDCVVIGNSETNDIQPAKAFGMRAIRVAIDEPPPPATSADYVCASLAEVEAVLYKAR
jgi:FMN phosphatase YigB (HAD superfamily)